MLNYFLSSSHKSIYPADSLRSSLFAVKIKLCLNFASLLVALQKPIFFTNKTHFLIFCQTEQNRTELLNSRALERHLWRDQSTSVQITKQPSFRSFFLNEGENPKRRKKRKACWKSSRPGPVSLSPHPSTPSLTSVHQPVLLPHHPNCHQLRFPPTDALTAESCSNQEVTVSLTVCLSVCLPVCPSVTLSV